MNFNIYEIGVSSPRAEWKYSLDKGELVEEKSISQSWQYDVTKAELWVSTHSSFVLFILHNGKAVSFIDFFASNEVDAKRQAKLLLGLIR